MKQTYLEPDVQVLFLSMESTVLNPASTEGYDVDNIDPFSSGVMGFFDSNL